MPESRRVLTRRGLLVAGATVGLVGVSACEPAAPRTDPETAPDTAPSRPSAAPDVALATTALAEIRVVREAVVSTRARFPALARPLGQVTAMHRSHEDALVDAVPDEASTTDITPAPYAVPRARAVALTALRAQEEELRDRLTELALEADSGVFAGLLGSMSAGVAQRVVSWPT